MGVNIRIRNGLAPSSGVGGASEGDLRGSHTDIIENTSGVVDLSGGHALVHEAGTPAMTVVVDTGVVYVPNSSFSEIDSDSVKFWEAVLSGTTGSRTLAIGSNSSGSTRYDLVCVKVDTGATPDSTASNVGSLIIVAGTPGAGVPATPSNYAKLAEVQVLNGAVTITNSKITDRRTQIFLREKFMPTTGEFLTQTNTKTLTNKTLIDKTNVFEEVTSVASSATPTPTIGSVRNYLKITALAAAAELQSPSGTPQDGNILIIRIKDNGTPRALTYNAIYRAIGTPLPSTTILGKTLYLGGRYNSADSKVDIVAVCQEN